MEFKIIFLGMFGIYIRSVLQRLCVYDGWDGYECNLIYGNFMETQKRMHIRNSCVIITFL